MSKIEKADRVIRKGVAAYTNVLSTFANVWHNVPLTSPRSAFYWFVLAYYVALVTLLAMCFRDFRKYYKPTLLLHLNGLLVAILCVVFNKQLGNLVCVGNTCMVHTEGRVVAAILGLPTLLGVMTFLVAMTRFLRRRKAEQLRRR